MRMLPLANSPNDMRMLGGEESKRWLVPLDEQDSVSSTLPGVQKHCDIQTTGPMVARSQGLRTHGPVRAEPFTVRNLPGETNKEKDTFMSKSKILQNLHLFH